MRSTEFCSFFDTAETDLLIARQPRSATARRPGEVTSAADRRSRRLDVVRWLAADSQAGALYSWAASSVRLALTCYYQWVGLISCVTSQFRQHKFSSVLNLKSASLINWSKYEECKSRWQSWAHTLYGVNGGCQYDLKNERMFLRRVKVDNIRLCDLRVGNYVNVLSRRLKIVDYARFSTQQHFKQHKERYIVSDPESGNKSHMRNISGQWLAYNLHCSAVYESFYRSLTIRCNPDLLYIKSLTAAFTQCHAKMLS